MAKSSIFQWLTFAKLIFAKGSIWIKPYDYHRYRSELWKSNTEAQRLNIKIELPKRKAISRVLSLPIIGPLTALISHYRNQKIRPIQIYHWPEKKLAYIRISKSGGTSVQAAILQKQYPELDVASLSVNQINEMGNVHIKPFLEYGYECFTLVRNPYDRLLSCYFDQVVGREERYYFDDYAFRVIKKGVSFYDFVQTIKDIPDSVKDLHFRPQHYNIINGVDVKFFRLEDQELLRNYLKKYDLRLGNFNRSETNLEYEKYYTQKIKKMVYDIYKEDFKKFGYSEN